MNSGTLLRLWVLGLAASLLVGSVVWQAYNPPSPSEAMEASEPPMEVEIDVVLGGDESSQTSVKTVPITVNTPDEEAADSVVSPMAEREKYYVADPDHCQRIKYQCEDGWDYFGDAQGCGCEKSLAPEEVPGIGLEPAFIDETNDVPVFEALNYSVVANPWSDRLNPDGAAPEGQWQAFYFDAVEPETVVKSEVVDRVSVNFNWTEMDINPETFASLWVGDWVFSDETNWEISLDQSGSDTRLIIDDLVVFEGGDSVTIPYTFSPGRHRVEIEFLNHSHTVEMAVHIGAVVPKMPAESVAPWLEKQGLKSFPLAVVSVYESGSFDTRLDLTLKEAAVVEPVWLLLHSYSVVEWDLSAVIVAVKGVVLASSAEGSRVVGLPEDMPVLYLDRGLNIPFELKPSCNVMGEYRYCDHLGVLDMDATTNSLGLERGQYFSGAYNAVNLALADIKVTEALRDSSAIWYAEWNEESLDKASEKDRFDIFK